MNKSDTKDNLSDILSNYNAVFSDGFTQRVMKNIDIEKEKPDMVFYNIFKWVAVSGVAAIFLLLFTIYITEGSFSADAIYGLMEYTSDESLLTSVNF